MLRIFLGLGLLYMVFCAAVPAFADPVYNGYDARSYLLGKCADSSILFIGTTHRQPEILSLVADVLPDLARVGVTHLALEIATDQQGAIDAFLNDSGEAFEIELASALDCPQYRSLFYIIKGLPVDRRIEVRAIDLPPGCYGGAMTRDRWMSDQLDRLIRLEGARKIVAIMGSLHTLKGLDWESAGKGKTPSIRSQLALRYPDHTFFSIINIIGDADSRCDFGRKLAGFKVSTAFDLDRRFAGWTLGLSRLIAIAPAEPWTLAEGIIIH